MLEKDLLPFFPPNWQDDNGFWSSNPARHTKSFGYTYSDVKGNPQATKANFRTLYFWLLRLQPKCKDWRPTTPPQMEPLDLSKAQVYKDHPEYVAPTPPVHINKQATASIVPDMQIVPQPLNIASLQRIITPARKYREWFVDDGVERCVSS